jgi:hypothetical protein
MTELKASVYDSEATPLGQVDHLDTDIAEPVPPPPTAQADPNHPPVPTAPCAEIPGVVSDERKRVVAAGVGAGVFGFLLGGPLGAVLLGFGAAYAAEQKDGAVGDTARAVGDVALTVQAKARTIDEEHHVVDKSKAAAEDALRRAKDLDRQYNVIEKSKTFAVYSWMATVTFVKEHNLIERGVNGIGKGFCWALEKVVGGSDRIQDGPSNAANAKK